MLMDGLSENIALLHLLNDIPGPNIVEQPLPSEITQKTPRFTHLEAQHEQEIVQDLAFLSAYSDNPLKVLAICVEARSAPNSLTIRWAANTGLHTEYVRGIRQIAKVLQNEASGVHREANKKEMLDAVVDLHRGRIFSRLRSRHAISSRKVAGKPPLVKHLQDAFPSKRESITCSAKSLKVRSLIAQFAETFACLEQMETKDARSSKSHNVLQSLLRVCDALQRCHSEVKMAMDKLPNQANTASILLSLRKMAHYTTAVVGLLRATRRYDCFKCIEIQRVEFQQGDISLSLKPERNGMWSKHLSSKLDQDTRSIFQRQATRLDKGIIEKKIVRSMSSEKRLHAEIQLILFYEEQGRQVEWPRIICATKSACFLCDLFIKKHGLFHCPSTHGKLYDAWSVPKVLAFQLTKTERARIHQVLGLVNEAVRTCFLQNLQAAEIRRCPPNESVVRFSPSTFTPSEVSVRSTQAAPSAARVEQRGRVDSAHSEHCMALLETGMAQSNPLKFEENFGLASSESTTPIIPVSPNPTSEVSESASAEITNSLNYDDKLPPAREETVADDSVPVPDQSISKGPIMRWNSDGHVISLPDNHDVEATSETRALDPIYLSHEVPVHHKLSISSPIHVHTPKIHAEISYDLLHTAISTTKSQSLEIVVEWLAEDAVNALDAFDAVDLNEDWRDKTALEGVALRKPGLLLRKGKEVISVYVLE